SVTDNAAASLNDDYVADNQIRGAVVDTKVDVPSDADGELPPAADFHGVAVVCNGDASSTDAYGVVTFAASCDSSDQPATCHHREPAVTYGDALHPGLNAFTATQWTNSRVDGIATTIPAEGNQWESCPTGSPCDVMQGISPPDALVDAGA